MAYAKKLLVFCALVSSMALMACVEPDDTTGTPEDANTTTPVVSTDHVFMKGDATYPDGTPVRNRPFAATITIEGVGNPTCEYGNSQNYKLDKAQQAVSGTESEMLAFDGTGKFENLALMRSFKWALGGADQCRPTYNYYNLNYVNVALTDLAVIRIDAVLSATEETCRDYCTSITVQQCSSYCHDHADDASCYSTCTSTTRASCDTRCSTATKIIASAVAYGTTATGTSMDSSMSSDAASGVQDEYSFKLIFSDLE